MKRTTILHLPGWMAFALILGCGQESKTSDGPAAMGQIKTSHHDHSHSSHGPHQGTIIELGDDEYHAEFVHDEKTCAVTIYILDSSARKAVPIEATQVLINLKHEGKPQQHSLAAEPQEGDGEGKSSRFVSNNNDELCHAIGQEGVKPKLQVTIDGKPYSGTIEHDHHEHSHSHKEGTDHHENAH